MSSLENPTPSEIEIPEGKTSYKIKFSKDTPLDKIIIAGNSIGICVVNFNEKTLSSPILPDEKKKLEMSLTKIRAKFKEVEILFE